MTNDEYQAAARERRRMEEEKSLRENMEAYNKSQRDQQAKRAEERKRAASRDLGASGGTPGIFGPGVDLTSYLQGKQQYDATKKLPNNTNLSPSYSGGVARAAAKPRAKKSGKGSGLAVLGAIAIIGFLVVAVKEDMFSSQPENKAASVASPEANPPASAPIAHPTNPSNESSVNTSPSEGTARASDSTPSTPFAPPVADTASKSTIVEPGDSPPTGADRTERAKQSTPSEAEASSLPLAEPTYHSTWRVNPSKLRFDNTIGSVRSPKPWPTQGMELRARHKGGYGCDGILRLKAERLEFDCPGDNKKSFSIAIDDVKEDDHDGIVTVRGEKYHFDHIPGSDTQATAELFQEWLVRTHLVADAAP